VDVIRRLAVLRCHAFFSVSAILAWHRWVHARVYGIYLVGAITFHSLHDRRRENGSQLYTLKHLEQRQVYILNLGMLVTGNLLLTNHC
jgi:hypothetical protein